MLILFYNSCWNLKKTRFNELLNSQVIYFLYNFLQSIQITYNNQ